MRRTGLGVPHQAQNKTRRRATLPHLPLPRLGLKETLSGTLILPRCRLSGRKSPGGSGFCRSNKNESSSEHMRSMVIDVRALRKAKGSTPGEGSPSSAVRLLGCRNAASPSAVTTPRGPAASVRTASDTAPPGQGSGAAPLLTDRHRQAPLLSGSEFPHLSVGHHNPPAQRTGVRPWVKRPSETALLHCALIRSQMPCRGLRVPSPLDRHVTPRR